MNPLRTTFYEGPRPASFVPVEETFGPQPLSLEQVQAILARVTYRPGWTLEARAGRVEGNPQLLPGSWHLVVRAPVLDAFAPAAVVSVPARLTDEEIAELKARFLSAGPGRVEVLREAPEPLTRVVELDVQGTAPPMADERAVLRYVQWRLFRIELHESREWLRVDGRIFDSPHAPNADRDL